MVEIEQAKDWFQDGTSLFLDARSPDLYAAGHIQGALNFPAEKADCTFIEKAEELKKAKRIIIYCDGKTNMSSYKLALLLRDMGFADVHILINGWTLWRQAGLPISA